MSHNWKMLALLAFLGRFGNLDFWYDTSDALFLTNYLCSPPPTKSHFVSRVQYVSSWQRSLQLGRCEKKVLVKHFLHNRKDDGKIPSSLAFLRSDKRLKGQGKLTSLKNYSWHRGGHMSQALYFLGRDLCAREFWVKNGASAEKKFANCWSDWNVSRPFWMVGKLLFHMQKSET